MAYCVPSPPMSIPPPPPPGKRFPPTQGGNCCQKPPPPPPGIDTITNEHITAAYYTEFMTDQSVAVCHPRL